MHGASQCRAGAWLRGGQVRRAAPHAPLRRTQAASGVAAHGTGPGRPVPCARSGVWPAVGGRQARQRAALPPDASRRSSADGAAGSETGISTSAGSSSWQHQMFNGTLVQSGCGPRRNVATRAELMFDYCDVTDNDPVRCHSACHTATGRCLHSSCKPCVWCPAKLRHPDSVQPLANG